MSASTRFILAAVIFGLAVNLTIIFAVVYRGNTELINEGAFIEDIGAFCFLSGAFTLLASAFYRPPPVRFLAIFLGTAYLMFFLREVDVGDLNIPAPIKQLTSNNLKDSLFAIVFVAFFAFYFIKLKKHTRTLVRSWKSPAAILLVIGCGFFVIASGFELSERVFMEELLETNAAYILLIGSLVFALPSAESGEDQATS